MRLAYADPPYPGKAHLYPENTEVDQAALVARLDTYDGWALSTASTSLRYVLPFCPHTVEVAAWIKTNAKPFNSDQRGSVFSWEPVVYVAARRRRLAEDRVRDVFHARVLNGRQYPGLTGAKPDGFAEWVFGLLEADTDDSLDDLFPGTGRVTAAWRRWQAAPTLFAGALGGRRSGEHAPMPGHAEVIA